MECFVSNFETDPLLLLKERIIKTDTLLEKYSSLAKKLDDLEKSYSQAIENEKKAKKDTIKVLKKYCKLAKKSNVLLNKIKTLEDEVNVKSNELRESQDEYAKLESVIQVYRTERKGHQCLKKDRDFLLTNLWKVLKRLQEEPTRGCKKNRKITETLFEKFERELMDLKLEDFRYKKVKKISRLKEKEESENIYSPESQGVGSTESDFIETDMGPDSVKSSFGKSDDNCVLEVTKNMDSNHGLLDTEQQHDKEANKQMDFEFQDLSLSDVSSGSFPDMDIPDDTAPQGENILKDGLEIHTSENNDLNLSEDEEEEDTCISMPSVNFTAEEGNISSTEIKSNVQEQDDSCKNDLSLNDNFFPIISEDELESEDEMEEEEELRQPPEQYRRTYRRQKFQSPDQNREIMGDKMSGNRHLTNMGFSADGANGNSDVTGIMETGNIDICNVSSETIDLDIDVTVEGIGSIPHHFEYCGIIYDFLKSSGGISYAMEENFYGQDSYLLFSTADELVGDLEEGNSATEKTLNQESYKTTSIFDVEDSGSFILSGCVSDDEMEGICVDFGSANGNETNLTEDLNAACGGNEKNDFTEHDEISRNTGNGNQVEENSQNIYDSGLKEINTNGNSDRIVDGMITVSIPNSEFTGQDNDIPDEEINRIFKEYEIVPLLSPLQEEVPRKRRKLSPQQGQEQNNCNRSEDIEVADNLENTEPSEEVVNDEPRGEELSTEVETGNEEDGETAVTFRETDDNIFLGGQVVEQQGIRMCQNVFLTNKNLKKICKVIWKKSLRRLTNFRRMHNAHLSCMDVVKQLLGNSDQRRFRMRNRRLRMRNRNYVSVNQRMYERADTPQPSDHESTPWVVEDVEETSTASQDDPPLNHFKVEECNTTAEERNTTAEERNTTAEESNTTAEESNTTAEERNTTAEERNTTAEECNTTAEVATDCNSTDEPNDVTVKSEEMQSEGNMSCDLPASEQEIEFCGDAGENNVDLEREFDSDNALPNLHSNDTVNNCETTNEDSAIAQDNTENLENAPESNIENALDSNIENIPQIDGISPDGPENKTNNLEKCDGGKQIGSGEDCSITEKSVITTRKRISRIRSQDNLVMEENNRTNGLIRKESPNLIRVGISEGSVPPANGTSTERSRRYSSDSINDNLPAKEVPEKPKCSTLKEKLAKIVKVIESPTKRRPFESSGNVTPKKIVQKEASKSSGNVKTVSTNRDIPSTKALRKKFRAFPGNFKSDKTYNKQTKWDLLSVCSESSEEGPPENSAPLNDTFSSEELETGDGSNILDSIMTAMTKQKEFFKVQTPQKKAGASGANFFNIFPPAQLTQPKNSTASTSAERKISNEYRMKGDSAAFLNLPYYWSVDNNFGQQAGQGKEGSTNRELSPAEEVKMKSAIKRELRKFLATGISSTQEGEEKIKPCISVMRRATESIVATEIVNEILANVDEEVSNFGRPAPPLTPSQHRIMIILKVLNPSQEQFHRVANLILQIIRSKIFPDNFFWPDDSLELASRFYAALCRMLNDFKGIWKFCIKVITSMKQRWCIPILVVLQVWPDIIHNAAYVQNNPLVTAFVNVILHSPQSRGMRRRRQQQKLLAIKHLLINFYKFDANCTMEAYTEKLWESLVNNTSGSVDAFILICKCRPWPWTRTNVIAKLLKTLESWMKGEATDDMVVKVLDILQKITTCFPDADSPEAPSFNGVISVFSQVLGTEKLDVISREKMVRILCDVCHYADVRDILTKFSEKLSTSEPLYAKIQKVLSSKKDKNKSNNKANTKTARMQKKNTQPNKDNGNSSREKSELEDVKASN